MTNPPPRHTATIADIDAANASDPRMIELDGQQVPFEVAYALRMTATTQRLYPDASELLLIAARAQHVRRWEIARASYPPGRQGYESWRVACRTHHADIATTLMARHGYSQDDVSQVAALIKKEHLKENPSSQALENVVAIVFVAHYLDDFIAGHAGYSDDKLIGILAKTFTKMSPHGHAAARDLALSPRAQHLVTAAAARATTQPHATTPD